MVGRARLFRETGSPLISGQLRRPARWPWVVAVLCVAAAAGVWVYLTWLR